MTAITAKDFILLPVYFFIFYLLAVRGSKKQPTPVFRKYYINSFLLHMLGSVMFAFLVQYYYGNGDAFSYYFGGEFIKNNSTSGNPFSLFFMDGKDLFDFAQPYDLNDWSRYGMQTIATLTTQKISGILSYLSFSSFIVIGLFMGRFAFLGQWKLFTVFNELLKGKNVKWLAYAVLYTPSIWFWGSGLGKDSICMGALGYLCYAAYRVFYKRKLSLFNLAVIAVMFTALYIVKSYIAAAFVAAAGGAFITGIIQKRKSGFGKFVTGFTILGLAGIIFALFFFSYLQQIVEESGKQIAVSVEAYAVDNDSGATNANFSVDNIDVSVGGFIMQGPGKVFSTLFRPFIWETRKPIMVFSALESLLMLLSFLYVLWLCRFFKFFVYVFSDPAATFSFLMCILLAMMIGFTTFNFGTMVRYRLPLLPFFGFLLINIYNRKKFPDTAHAETENATVVPAATVS